MEYTISWSDEAYNAIKKIAKKNRPLWEHIHKKLREIIQHPEHYKPLRYELAGYRRVHFGSFVLKFAVRDNVVKIISIDHHDKAY